MTSDARQNKSSLRQTLQVDVTSDTQKIPATDCPKWGCTYIPVILGHHIVDTLTDDLPKCYPYTYTLLRWSPPHIMELLPLQVE